MGMCSQRKKGKAQSSHRPTGPSYSLLMAAWEALGSEA